MKKSAYLLLLLPLLAGCKGSTDSPVESATKISLLGSISSAVQTRGDGVIDPSASGFATTSLSLNFARIDQNASTGNYPGYGSTALNATRTAGTGSQSITFDSGSEQYYLPGTTNSSSKLVGWYPRTAVASGVVSFTIDGTTDIMLSNEVTGSSSALFSAAAQAFTFNHLLTQLQFKAYATDATVKAAWGTITSIKVKSQSPTCAVTLPGSAQGSVSFSGTPADLLVTGATFPLTMGESSSDNAVVAGYSMIAPVASGTVTLEVATSAAGTKSITIPVPSGGFLAGNAYVITLSFSSLSNVSGVATIGAWKTNTVAAEVTVS